MAEASASRAAPDLAALIEQIRPTVLAGERTLPVGEVLRPVFPLGGLARGSRIAIRGTGAVSLAMASLAEASREGSWLAVVGLGSWGWAAAAHAGVCLERSVFVAEPPVGQWGATVAALVDAVDLVVVDPRHQVTATDARRLAARARERGAIVVAVPVADGRPRFRWPTEPDLSLTVTTVSWDGLERGHGTLGDRIIAVATGGRRGAARQRSIELCLAADGTLRSARPDAGRPDAGRPEREGTGRHLRSVG